MKIPRQLCSFMSFVKDRFGESGRAEHRSPWLSNLNPNPHNITTERKTHRTTPLCVDNTIASYWQCCPEAGEKNLFGLADKHLIDLSHLIAV
jgi:hypothetical protein